MPEPQIRVTIEDLKTGEKETSEISDNFVLITAGRCYVSYEQRFANGTTQLTVKRDG